jgi:hypothetical protein
LKALLKRPFVVVECEVTKFLYFDFNLHKVAGAVVVVVAQIVDRTNGCI